MRSGAEYIAGLRDGRDVWVIGQGRVDDVTTHPATAAMVRHYAAWYDRHEDPAWQPLLCTPPDDGGPGRPLAFEVPRSASELRRASRAIAATSFATAANVTHTPAYGALIALAVLDAVEGTGCLPDRVAAAEAQRASLAQSGRFLVFSSGGGPVSDRFRRPEDRLAIRLLRETDAGIVVGGFVGMHTATPFADEVFVLGGARSTNPDHAAWFTIPVNAPGVRVYARQPVPRSSQRFSAPLSHRFDELDAFLWLEDVFVPWEKVFALRGECMRTNWIDGGIGWLLWHQLVGWLSRAEFTLGLALALVDALALKDPRTGDLLTDMMTDVQTIASCLVAAELDTDVSLAGRVVPRMLHLVPASIHAISVRQKMSETLRILCASQPLIAPTDSDLADPRIGPELERAWAGGRHSAVQRSALLQLAWEHISSGLDAREASYELFGNAGVLGWRGRLQRHFARGNELANGVLALLDVEMPRFDIDQLAIGALTWRRRRPGPGG